MKMTVKTNAPASGKRAQKTLGCGQQLSLLPEDWNVDTVTPFEMQGPPGFPQDVINQKA
jgi:hypothetical protein